MRSRTWLVVGLVCALGGPALAQAPAAGAPAVPATAKAKGKGKKGKQPKQEAPKLDIAATVQALTGANIEAAAKAAEALGGSAEGAAHEALLDALAMGMPPAVAVAAIGALAMHPAPPDVGSLIRYADHHNPTVRSAALAGLAAYPAPDAKKAIVAGLHDMTPAVRAAAAMAAAKGRVREALDPMFELLGRNEEGASKAFATMADPDLARKIADQFGKVPEGILAETLGAILKRPDFGPDEARVELVRALGKIQDQAAINALTDYLDATPKNPPRQSRNEAQKMVEARLGGGAK